MFYFYSTKEGFVEKEGLFSASNIVAEGFYKNGILKIGSKKIKTDRPFLLIEKFVQSKRVFVAGFITYDYGNRLMNVRYDNPSLLSFPDIYVLFFRRFSSAKLNKNFKTSIFDYKQLISKEDFINAVKRAKYYIKQGDIYQINLSFPIVVRGVFNKHAIFKALIDFQPTPYMVLIENRNFSLISGSMELFLEKKGRKLTTKPIKGTRPRGKDKEDDKKIEKELYSNEKERAENLMITDLMRNDLGKICEYGSVKVEKLFEVEKYTSLFQMSSTVSGVLRQNVNLQQIIEATFPPGSITGAPKKRAMEIISELEKFKRSVYCGATFIIRPDLDFTMSVAIRQILFQRDRAGVFVGSGIVADSIPEKEYEETLLKAGANIRAIEKST